MASWSGKFSTGSGQADLRDGRSHGSGWGGGIRKLRRQESHPEGGRGTYIRKDHRGQGFDRSPERGQCEPSDSRDAYAQDQVKSGYSYDDRPPRPPSPGNRMDQPSLLGSIKNVKNAILDSTYAEKGYCSACEKLEDANSALRNDLRSQVHRADALERALRATEEKNVKLQQGTDKILLSKEKKELFLGPQAEDETIRTAFVELFGRRIMQWSLNFSSKNSTSAPLQDGHLPDLVTRLFLIVIPTEADFSAVLKDKKARRLFVRGWASLQITLRLFHDQLAWVDEQLEDSILAIEKFLKFDRPNTVSIREFHDWRALTVTLVSKASPQDIDTSIDERLWAIARDIVDPIKSWTVIENKKAIIEELMPILRDALALSRLCRSQRASWRVDFPPSSDSTVLAFDPLTMRDKNIDEEDETNPHIRPPRRAVHVVYSPALFKRGDQDGERYDMETPIEPCNVLCKAMPSLEALRREQVTRHHREIPTRDLSAGDSQNLDRNSAYVTGLEYQDDMIA